MFDDLRIYVFAVLVLALADGAAGLIGRLYGGKGYRVWGGTKSATGNAVFFVTALALTLAFAGSIGVLSFGILPVVLASAGALTLVEAAFSRGFDNLAVPLSAAAVAWFYLSIF